MAYKPKYEKEGSVPSAPAEYQLADPYKEYTSDAIAPEAYVPGTYSSKYADRIDSALNTVTNWNYDPLQDASYQALAKVYGARGNQAAKNSLADAASLNGGYGTSYAVSAAQQARNQYNQELASLIPDLEANAFNKAQTTLSALRQADDTDYGRYRDTEGDRQWKYGMDYQAYRDKESDNQWKYQMGYQQYRDSEADRQWQWSQNYQMYQDAIDQYRWGREYNLGLYQWKQDSKKANSGGGRGGRSGGGGGGGYTGAGYPSGVSSDPWASSGNSTPRQDNSLTADRTASPQKRNRVRMTQ